MAPALIDAICTLYGARRFVIEYVVMTFRFNLRLRPAIVAHTYNCLRAFFSRLDETHAHSADDAEMSFVCAHTNNFVCRLPFGLRCRKILQSHDYAAD